MTKALDSEADAGPAASHTDSLIRLFKRYDPDANLGSSDLKAKTLRQATEQARDLLRTNDCSLDDAQRLDEALTSK